MGGGVEVESAQLILRYTDLGIANFPKVSKLTFVKINRK